MAHSFFSNASVSRPTVLHFRVVSGLMLAAVALWPGVTAGAQAATRPLLAANSLSPVSLAPVSLRGYGSLSGRFQELALPGGPASALVIRCQSVQKAQLTQAKYLSDLTLLPGVTTLVLPGKLFAYRADGEGVMAAVRDGVQVVLLSAWTADDLEALFKREFKGRPAAGLSSRSEAAVPMFLDRWDKFGFRFYYRPWETPPGETTRTYDFTKEFDWAREQERSGLVFWDQEYVTDTAEGLMNEVWFDWAAREARAQGLPVAINTGAGSGSATTWLLNRYQNEEQQKMPQFTGEFYKVASQDLGGQGVTSWNAQEAADVELGVLQQSIRHYAAEPNVVSFLEPHGETRHGPHDIFLEYGPVADRTYRTFLKARYGTPTAVGTRWFGDTRRFKTWADVRVPEIAAFEGWSTDALDLAGAWKVGYEKPSQQASAPGKPPLTEPAPEDWYSADFDDSAWPEVTAPGNDRTFFIPHRPAVYRRTLHVPDAWKAAHPRAWLYCWDLNSGNGETLRFFLNGHEVGTSPIRFNTPHWCAIEVSEALRAGDNQLSIRLPQGFLAYRVYLSGQAPTQYPNFGPGRNAQWVDFSDWIEWSRVEAIRRGMEMIRQVDPDRQITLMHPDDFSDGIKTLAEDYGGEFHNTGYMGAFYADYNPLLMQGSGLPYSLEPGGPPPDLPTYKHMMGLYFSEGTQGLDYYIHIGDVLWHPAIKAYFEKTQHLVHLIGKYHAPPAQIAVLYSNRVSSLTGYPWGNDPNVNLQSGYWNWNAAAYLRDRYPRDGVTERDFATGNAARYRVIVDSNTSIMDEELLRQIERYVRAGGVFITFGQTGRHTPTQKDAWPIARLTGYRVTHLSHFDAAGRIPDDEWHFLKDAPGQSVFPAGAWAKVPRANGLSLQKASPDCRDLALWDDGTTAIGMRPLGKGFIVEMGVKFSGDKMFDRIEPGGYSPEVRALLQLFTRLMEWRDIAPTPAHLSAAGAPAGPVILRRWISNNGLYDVWTLWNQDGAKPVTTDLVFDTAPAPGNAFEVETGLPVALNHQDGGVRLSWIALEPSETRIFLTPRRMTTASLEWFNLQRNWWRGTTPASKKPLPAPPHRLSVDLSDGWFWQPLQEGEDATRLAGAISAGGEKMRLGIWSLPDHPAVKHALFRRTFTVPAAWRDGRISLWVQSFWNTTFIDRGRVFLDGKLVKDWSADGVSGMDAGLAPGTTHLLAVEAEGPGALVGSRGTAWLAFVPDPLTSINLAGEWLPSADALVYGDAISLPGDYRAYLLRRAVNFRVGREMAGKNAVVSVDGTGPLVGVLINGHWVRRHHHLAGNRWDLNITPWVHFGGENQIEIGCWGGVGQGHLTGVRLNFYDPAVYP